ncbi:hypothetical protein ACFQ21_23140 [Ohtaekwangia kribbensis]|jgi:hypothetical protein|uniref:Uncharacterized protein n=1 Tax=Ohtaekwangia kribbensis TaxID=688913 RepID=A0ABW3K7U8_9BACT
MAQKEHIQTTTIITGVLTALIIVVSQLFYFEQAHTCKKEIKTEQQQGDQSQSDDGAYITLPSSTLPSSTHVEFNQEAFCLFEILFEEEKTEEHDFNVSLPLNKFFQTLFGAIISPNAP